MTSWGLTSALNDISDLWQEELNEDKTHYRVDGEWREISYIEEIVKIKDQDDLILKIGSTHRGPLISSEVLSGASVLFGGKIPSLKTEQFLSFGWSYIQAPGDRYLEFLSGLAQGSSVKELIAQFDSDDGPFVALPQNLVLADNHGDIAFLLMTPIPRRKNQTPHIGSRVLDGRTTEFDWDGLLTAKELPRSVNPAKGYIVTANNR